MQHYATHSYMRIARGKILQMDHNTPEFELEFERAKSKKSLVFSELIWDLPCYETENVVEDSLPDESLFLISSNDLWYDDIIIYLQT